MIITLILVVLLGEQMVSTVNGDALSKCNVTNTNYKFVSENNACSISDETPETGSYFCVGPPMPELKAISDFPRMFQIGVALDLQYDVNYCGSKFMSWSLQENCMRKHSGFPDNVPDDYARNCYKYRALSAVTHLKAELYMKGYPFSAGRWDPKGEFGPLFYRANRETQADQTLSGKIAATNIQGFENYNQERRIAYFSFFLPNSMATSDSTVQTWRSHEPLKTDFEVAVDLIAACRDGLSNQICEARKSELASTYLESYIPLFMASTEAKIKSAVLKQDSLQLNLEWSSSELAEFTQQVLQQGPDSCKPKFIVVVYDSNPPPHGNSVGASAEKNINVRSVLTSFSKILAWNQTSSHVEDSFVFNSAAEPFKWGLIDRKMEFLKNINSFGGESDAMLFYSNWAKESGLKIAVTTCKCRNSPVITDRNRGCREYKHHPLSIDAAYWTSLN